MYKDKEGKLNNELVRAYHNVLLLEETKRKYSRTTTSFRSRNLMELIYIEGPKSAKEISKFLKISKPSTTAILDKLEDLGYIERIRDDKDERSTLINLTRKGHLVTTYQLSHRNEMMVEVLKDFTDEEKDILLKGFERLNYVFENCEETLEKTYSEKDKVRKMRKSNGKNE